MLLFLFLLAAESPSSEDVFDILEEQEQVVSTGFIPLKVNESAYGVWIIDRETILQTAAQSIADLLRLIPGIIVREISPGFTETYLRYTSVVPNNQSLVLVDGRTIQGNIFSSVDKNAVEIKDIERIEVTMGPSSTLYGSNALTGVINIVSRRPEKGQTFVEAELRGGVGYGEGTGVALPAGTFFAALNHGWTDGGLRLSTYGDYLPSFRSYVAGPNDTGILPARRIGGTADIEHTLGSWDLRARASGVSHQMTLPTFTMMPMVLHDYSLTLSARKNRLFADGDSLTMSGWARYFGMDYALYPAPYAPVSLDGAMGSGEMKVQYLSPRFLFGNQLVAGLLVQMYGFAGQAIVPAGRTGQVYSIFLEDNWRPITQILVTAGVRLETNESPPLRPFQRFNASPHLAFVYLPNPQHSLRLEYATSFRTPTLHEGFLNATNPDGVPISFGLQWQPLERFSQIGFTYQGGIGWFRPRVDLGATRVDNVIISQPLTEGETEPYGISQDYPYRGNFLPAYYRPFPINAWLPYASAKLEGDWRHTKLWLSYAFAPIAPMHSASAGFSTTFARLRFSTELYFLDEYGQFGASSNSNAARLVWNAAIRLALDDAQRWFVSVEGTNLLDARLGLSRPLSALSQSDFPSAERIGQRLFLSVRYHLN